MGTAVLPSARARSSSGRELDVTDEDGGVSHERLDLVASLIAADYIDDFCTALNEHAAHMPGDALLVGDAEEQDSFAIELEEVGRHFQCSIQLSNTTKKNFFFFFPPFFLIFHDRTLGQFAGEVERDRRGVAVLDAGVEEVEQAAELFF